MKMNFANKGGDMTESQLIAGGMSRSQIEADQKNKPTKVKRQMPCHLRLLKCILNFLKCFLCYFQIKCIDYIKKKIQMKNVLFEHINKQKEIVRQQLQGHQTHTNLIIAGVVDGGGGKKKKKRHIDWDEVCPKIVDRMIDLIEKFKNEKK
jgi:hypothetical protein